MPPKASSASSPCSAASCALPRALAPAFRCTRPDRTPDSRHSALLRDAGGRGTALSVKPVKAGRLRRPGRTKPLAPERPTRTAWPKRTEPAGEAHTWPGRARNTPRQRGGEARPIDGARDGPQGRATQPLRPSYSREAPCPRPGWLPRALSATGRPNTGDKLRSGARVLPRRRGHEAAP